MDKETAILQNIIKKWIENNIELVVKVQNYSKKVSEYGLIDPGRTLPFQIVPTEISDSKGNILCKIFLNIESPIYGFFVAEFDDEVCNITCPNNYKTSQIVLSHSEFETWLDTVNSEMDIFYQLSSAADQRQFIFCDNTLNDMLSSYKECIQEDLEAVKSYIESDEKIGIVSGKVYALAKEAQRDFSKALLIPPAWVVFKDLNDLPDEGEPVDDYIDEEKTDKLSQVLIDFQKKEAFLSAPIFLAQRICIQAGLPVSGFSLSEEQWVRASRSDEGLDLVLSPIDIKKFQIELIA